jgi:hypothetical protein
VSLEQSIHPSVPWPGIGHPEAMKMSCRRHYFHISAYEVNVLNFTLTSVPGSCTLPSYLAMRWTCGDGIMVV